MTEEEKKVGTSNNKKMGGHIQRGDMAGHPTNFFTEIDPSMDIGYNSNTANVFTTLLDQECAALLSQDIIQLPHCEEEEESSSNPFFMLQQKKNKVPKRKPNTTAATCSSMVMPSCGDLLEKATGYAAERTANMDNGGTDELLVFLDSGTLRPLDLLDSSCFDRTSWSRKQLVSSFRPHHIEWNKSSTGVGRDKKQLLAAILPSHQSGEVVS